MKVLMLGWELPPHNSGGLGVACLQLTKALASSGADIEFVLPHYPSDSGFEHMKVTSAFTKAQQFLEIENVYDSYKFKVTGEHREYFNISDQQSAFEEAVSYIASRAEFDIIHAHEWLTFRAALRAKWETGKPLVVHIHALERDRAGGADGNPLVREIEATAMMLADQVIAVSEYTKQAIVDDYGVPADKIKVVHNSIDVEDFMPVDGYNDYKYFVDLKNSGWKVMSYVGRITIQKGLTHLLKAAAETMRREPKTFVMFVGNGEQRDELIELAAGLGIADRTFFVDFQRGKRLRDAFKVSDLFVMPSVSEPFGLVALEAAGYDVPVLVSKQSGVAEVLQSCLKVDYWDIDEMANLMTSVLRENALAGELRNNAKREFERLSWNGAANNLMNIYRTHVEGVPA
ncbi:MAG TPA: glycosyltransferase family 4 protein [Candidatus Binatia bacterium]|nr:glycosyltransferase family 4 protein [Candidatus Binatia bacterium]